MFLERREPSCLRLRLSGKGPPGFVEGEATLELVESETEAGLGTEFHYVADVQVGGSVGRLGQRMLSGLVKEMAGQFFEAFGQGSAPRNGEAAGSHPAPQAAGQLHLLLQLVWRSLLRLLGLRR